MTPLPAFQSAHCSPAIGYANIVFLLSRIENIFVGVFCAMRYTLLEYEPWRAYCIDLHALSRELMHKTEYVLRC
jgi:hypothetical protein